MLSRELETTLAMAGISEPGFCPPIASVLFGIWSDPSISHSDRTTVVILGLAMLL